MTESLQLSPRGNLPRGKVMQTPDEVAAMLRHGTEFQPA
jgi:hypothetical protein